MKKKIMFFRPMFYMGGTEIAILNLIKRLKSYDIYIGYTDDTSDKSLLARYEEYAKVVKVDKPIETDTLINCSPYITSFDEAKNVSRKSTYLWFHHFGSRGESILSSPKHYDMCDKIIVVSESTENIIKQQNYYENIKDKIEVIYNILNVEEILKLGEKPIDLELSKTLNIVTVSRLSPKKGFDRKLHLARLLREANVDFKWFIVGSNYYKDVENEIIHKFDEFKDNFVFFGFLDNPYNIIKKCDYLALLSDDETWGLTITEAKLLGVPCIVTDFDVAYEQVTYRNGIILSRNNVSSYKYNIDYILSHKRRLKHNLKNYNYSNQETLTLWNELLNE